MMKCFVQCIIDSNFSESKWHSFVKNNILFYPLLLFLKGAGWNENCCSFYKGMDILRTWQQIKQVKITVQTLGNHELSSCIKG